MNTRLSPILWILIVALATHGAIPGVVVCLEATGQVKFEAIQDKCCYGEAKPSNPAAFFVLPTWRGPEPDGSCGPCTDTLISPVQVTKPTKNRGASVSALPSATLVLDSAAIKTEARLAGQAVNTDAALILIKTTTLLI